MQRARAGAPGGWFGKGLVRAALLVLASIVIAGVAASFGIARDYGYLRGAVLTGSPDGHYHTLATRLADRAQRRHGTLTVVPTEGSVENVRRLGTKGSCDAMFALIQDGTPVAPEARLELLGRLPQPETLLILGRPGNAFHTFADLRGASIGIGPEGSGTAQLARELFEDEDLRQLQVRFSNHGLSEQARLVAEGALDLAVFVMQEDAEFLAEIFRQHRLDIVAPEDFPGLVARYPWLGLGRIAAGRYDLVRALPATDKHVARLATLVVTSPCARRADRIAFLMLLGAELPGFVRTNPPNATSADTQVPLAHEAQQFFRTGEPAMADLYFPWLVNILSPAYWVYLVMAVTVLFNGMSAYSRFRLWRIDATRERLEAGINDLVDSSLTRAEIRDATAAQVLSLPEKRAAAQGLLARLTELRARCERQTNSFVTPMGDEMFYRYQQTLIDEAMTTLSRLLRRAPSTG